MRRSVRSLVICVTLIVLDSPNLRGLTARSREEQIFAIFGRISATSKQLDFACFSPVFFSSALVVGLRDGIDMHALNDIRSFLTRPLPGIIIF